MSLSQPALKPVAPWFCTSTRNPGLCDVLMYTLAHLFWIGHLGHTASFHGCWPLKAKYKTNIKKGGKQKRERKKTKPGSAPASFQAMFRPHASYTALQRYVIIWQSHVLYYPFSVLKDSC